MDLEYTALVHSDQDSEIIRSLSSVRAALSMLLVRTTEESKICARRAHKAGLIEEFENAIEAAIEQISIAVSEYLVARLIQRDRVQESETGTNLSVPGESVVDDQEFLSFNELQEFWRGKLQDETSGFGDENDGLAWDEELVVSSEEVEDEQKNLTTIVREKVADHLRDIMKFSLQESEIDELTAPGTLLEGCGGFLREIGKLKQGKREAIQIQNSSNYLDPYTIALGVAFKFPEPDLTKNATTEDYLRLIGNKLITVLREPFDREVHALYSQGGVFHDLRNNPSNLFNNQYGHFQANPINKRRVYEAALGLIKKLPMLQPEYIASQRRPPESYAEVFSRVYRRAAESIADIIDHFMRHNLLVEEDVKSILGVEYIPREDLDVSTQELHKSTGEDNQSSVFGILCELCDEECAQTGVRFDVPEETLKVQQIGMSNLLGSALTSRNSISLREKITQSDSQEKIRSDISDAINWSLKYEFGIDLVKAPTVREGYKNVGPDTARRSTSEAFSISDVDAKSVPIGLFVNHVVNRISGLIRYSEVGNFNLMAFLGIQITDNNDIELSSDPEGWILKHIVGVSEWNAIQFSGESEFTQLTMDANPYSDSLQSYFSLLRPHLEELKALDSILRSRGELSVYTNMGPVTEAGIDGFDEVVEPVDAELSERRFETKVSHFTLSKQQRLDLVTRKKPEPPLKRPNGFGGRNRSGDPYYSSIDKYSPTSSGQSDNYLSPETRREDTLSDPYLSPVQDAPSAHSASTKGEYDIDISGLDSSPESADDGFGFHGQETTPVAPPRRNRDGDGRTIDVTPIEEVAELPEAIQIETFLKSIEADSRVSYGLGTNDLAHPLEVRVMDPNQVREEAADAGADRYLVIGDDETHQTNEAQPVLFNRRETQRKGVRLFGGNSVNVPGKEEPLRKHGKDVKDNSQKKVSGGYLSLLWNNRRKKQRTERSRSLPEVDGRRPQGKLPIRPYNSDSAVDETRKGSKKKRN